MRDYTLLKKYIKEVENNKGWGCVPKYEKSVCPDGNIAYLCGHYQALLQDALDWIPAAIRAEIMNR